jgi:hypothetical protein
MKQAKTKQEAIVGRKIADGRKCDKNRIGYKAILNIYPNIFTI